MSATYSPDDNKLRLYPDGRLDAETYARVRAAGFRWAPSQELFVAPAWTPEREDLLLEMCGEIGDDDSSLVDRAEERAERFDEYSTKRAADAVAAADAVERITSGIPMGQPILVGHHSEKHARKDAERIESGMRRALKMWDTSEYWVARAAGAKAHASYKALPAVRARRIKKLEAERRAVVRAYTPTNPDQVINQEPWYCPVCRECFCKEHPEAKVEVPHVYCGASRGGCWKPVACLPKTEAASQRWVAHLDLRLTYERAMLEDQGATRLLDKPKRPKAPPLLNYRAVAPLATRNVYRNDDSTLTYRQVEITKEQLRKVRPEYKGTRFSLDGSHRFRIASERSLGLSDGKSWDFVAVFLTDSKVHARPEEVAA